VTSSRQVPKASDLLVVRLLEVIAETEQAENAKAKEMVRHNCPECSAEASQYQMDHEASDYVTVPNVHFVKLLPCGHSVDWSKVQRTPYEVSLADEAVFRRCAADRRLLELHKPESDKPNEEPGIAFPFICRTCGSGEWYEYPMPWPCDTLKILASSYGISTEEETT
jgi:hypothetical protein